jgi:hypothetical protein
MDLLIRTRGEDNWANPFLNTGKFWEEGKITSPLSATFRYFYFCCRRQELVESSGIISFLRGKCTKLGEGDTYLARLGLS